MAIHRTGCLGLSAVAATLVGLVTWGASRVAIFPPPAPPAPIADTAAAAALDRERAVAEALRFGAADTGEQSWPSVTTSATWARELTLAARECVAVVVATSGYGRVLALALDASSAAAPASELVADVAVEGAAAHVQWCSPTAATIRARATVSANRQEGTAGRVPTHLRYAVLRAPWDTVGGPARLNRGAFSAGGLAVLHGWVRGRGPNAALEALRAQTPAGATVVGAPLRLTLAAGARLVPASSGTYAALYRASVNDGGLAVNPRVDPASFAGDASALAGYREGAGRATGTFTPDAAPPASHDPIVDIARNNFLRVLAVVDRSALPTPCTALQFARMLPTLRADVFRVDPVSWRVEPLARVENVATDVACAPSGIIAYAVRDTDQEDYTLQLYTPPAASDAGAARAP